MKRLKFPAAVLAAACIFLQPSAAVQGARSAMAQWAFAVAPALFPFLVLLPSLTGKEACTAYGRLFARPMRLLSLPASAAPAVIIGLLAGSPGGALALVQLAANTELSRAQCRRIALAVSGVSPAYLILGVGQGLCGDTGIGLRLALMQLLTQLMLLILLRPRESGEAVSSIYGAQMRRGILSAVETVLGICGYMVIFSAITSVLGVWIGAHTGKYLLLAADLPSGLPVFAENPVLMAAGIGFTGLCIAMQNLDALRPIGLKAGEWLAVRGFAALIMAALSILFLPASHPAGESLPKMRMIYAFSLLAASFSLIPVLNFLSKNLFLNKRKFSDSLPENA